MCVLGAVKQIREGDLRQPEWEPQTGNITSFCVNQKSAAQSHLCVYGQSNPR